MKIGLQTWGTNGDIQPFIELGKGLNKAGHTVTLAYTSIEGKRYFEPEIEMVEASHSINFNPPKSPYAIGAKPGSFGEYHKLIQYYFDPFTESMLDASERLCNENDLVVGHSICHTLATASELHDCPRVALALAPMVVRSNSVSPAGESLGRLVNSTMWSLGDEVSSRLWFKEGRQLREQKGLPRVKSLQSEVFTSDVLTIVACSPALVERPSDWPKSVALTGFLNPKINEAAVPPKIQCFLDNGEPPVYMTFGSCMSFQPKYCAELMVNAALASGKRAIIQTSINHPAFDSNEHLLKVDQVAHSAVFPHCSLIVHHGGAGTTQSGLFAGKPSVVVAHGFDQAYWAQQMSRLGVGGTPLLIDSVTESELAITIKQVLSNPDIRMRAYELSQAISQEDGVASAVERVGRICSYLNH